MNVVSFYQFADIVDPTSLCSRLRELCVSSGLLGTVLLADEGVNGTLAGQAEDVQAVLDWLQKEMSSTTPIEGRWTESAEAPFRRMRVKVKKEIVTLGRPDIKPHRGTGEHISPAKWNELIDDPNAVIIDTRNRYEVEVGTFKNAIDPGTDSFREFPQFAKELADAGTDRPLAMFCTGGIRCEKASALMMELGFDEVYHLQGGILNYLEQISDDDSRWGGECFVFDTRVAVDRDLSEGAYVQCHACRRPLSVEDVGSPDYREGVSCPKCVTELETDRALRLEERRKQVRIARERGEQHIGQTLESVSD